ncbi:hypothetical protein D7X30_00570 [Corallococcus sp. AB011P]|uniref:hypothetical protein n=1 Tax=unclassified Corallococcus TaxID=2685029 RepID=UPI000EA2E0E2|nr:MULTISPECIES: hypothetical protein [unclassified Corallococcus]RKG61873.1 hypothetical protein D7X30_00570 [Corallococcus sp. AB011P]RKH88032.1 hypothetical protein D7Y21_16405 [Corallococcus sp. AB045]
MKKLIIAAVMCLGTTAFAQETTGTPENPGPSAPSSRQHGRRSTGIEAQQVGPAIGDAAKSVVGAQTSKEEAAQTGVWKEKHAFNMEGTVKAKDKDDITLARKDTLPEVKLEVRDKTKVTLDDQPAKVSDLPEGANVRAKFQLEGDDSVALELKATSPKPKK